MFARRFVVQVLRQVSPVTARTTSVCRLSVFDIQPCPNRNLLCQAVSVRCMSNQAKKSAVKDKAKGKAGKPKILLSDDELSQEIEIDNFRAQLLEIVDKLKNDYVISLNVRSGVGIETLPVEFENEVHPMKDLATISKKGANLLVLNFGALPTALKSAEKAILKSGMNVNPQLEGTVIYLTLPKITREHRETLAKSARSLVNKAKEDASKLYGVYSREAKKKVKDGLSQDIAFNVTENIKYLVDGCVSECDVLLQSKTKELLGE